MAENWLERTERMLVQMHCTPDESLECATALLQDEAYQWWVSMTRTAPPGSITWKFFLDEFKKHYVGRIYLANMRREFHNLRQRQMSVTEYQREFTRLSKYALEILVSEEEKCRRFEDGLNDLIRAHVTGFFHDDFSKIVACALNVERVKKEEKERKIKDRERKIQVSPVHNTSRGRDSGDHRVPVSLQLRLPVGILLYRHRQLRVHQEVLLEDRLLLIASIVGKIIKENVGDLHVLV